MFPLRDSTPRDHFPFINYLIIFLNIYVFYIQLISPNFERFVSNYAFIPSQFNFFELNSYKYIFTSIFLHGGFLHILSNMWFLHIFGDNLEDRIGHFKYLLFYLVGGFAATMAQYIIGPTSTIPVIGASGAISAVIGAYFVFFRGNTIKTLITFFLFWQVVDIPVGFFLGYWFVLQIFSGLGSLSQATYGGVAWFAHVGGFVYGYLIAKKAEIA